MTNQEFIEEVAKYCLKYAPKYGHRFISVAIAQACLESGYGTGVYNDNRNKVRNPLTGEWRHNYFGMKYRNNRVNCHCGYFSSDGTEQRKDGTYVPTTTDWYKFESLEKCVEGYYQFINIPNYAKVKTASNAFQYLQEIKNAGYASSLKYVENVWNTLEKNNLQKYDEILAQNLGKPTTPVQNTSKDYSPLVSYINLAPSNHKTSPRNHKIDTITIHCYVGQVTAKQGCDYFATTTSRASANYVVGKDGSIGLSVPETDRSWCSSNAANDHRAVTIEVACEKTAPYQVTDAAYKALIELCADICRRNGIKKLLWKADPNLIGQVDKQNMTVHRWFAKKACPGEYLFNAHTDIANQVNKKLGIIPENAEKIPQVSNNTNANGNYITYIIQRGDTLNKIAAKFSTKTEILRVDNNIEDINKIITGKPLKIRILGKMTVKTNGSNLRIRQETNTNCSTLGYIANKQVVNILEKTNNAWYKIEYNGIVGYCSAAYLI